MELNRYFNLTLQLAIAFFLISSSAWATTVSFQEGVSGYAGTRNALINTGNTNEHNSSAMRIRAASDGEFSILYFDISTIPSTATVNTAVLDITVSEQNCTAETVGVKSIENPDNSGAFDANAAEDDTFNDYATYAYKDHGSTTDWDVAASNSFADVDDNANEDTANTSTCPGNEHITFDIPVMVQGWVTNPNSNGGMVFTLSNTGNALFRSKFNATSSIRPLLTIDYTDGGGGGGSSSSVAHVFGNIYSGGNLYIK